MNSVTIENLRVEFGGATAVDGADIQVGQNEFVTLLGPSGCGKTTTLRCIAGLERPVGGRITVEGTTVADPERGVFVPPHVRRLGMVFQSYALWPHMTAGQTVAFPMRAVKEPKAKIKAEVGRLLELVGLGHMHDRPIGNMSGGQQQRVALARALANDSQVVLYDEPLSNLDAQLRGTMRDEIRRLHHELGRTSIFVTHDHHEALSLSDRIIVMRDGKVEQTGEPKSIYARPASVSTARFVGFENLLEARVIGGDADATAIQLEDSDVRLGVAGGNSGVANGVVGFRAEHVRVSAVELDGYFPARIVGSTFLGEELRLKLSSGQVLIHAALVGDSATTASFEPGAHVYVHIPPERVVLLAQP